MPTFPKGFRRNRVSPRNKFGARKVQLHEGGRFYDSKLEADYRKILELMMIAGEIKDLIDQPQVYLTDAQIGYRPDFAYVERATGQRVFIEAKGMETEGYRLKLKLWEVYGPGPLYIVKRLRAKDAPTIVRKVIPKGINQQTERSL